MQRRTRKRWLLPVKIYIVPKICLTDLVAGVVLQKALKFISKYSISSMSFDITNFVFRRGS